MARHQLYMNPLRRRKHQRQLFRRGNGLPPDRRIQQQMATQSYENAAASLVDGWQLISQSPTLKFYLQGNTIIVAVRGTKPTDPTDLAADAAIAVGQLRQSQRFQKDLQFLQNFQRMYSPYRFDYYGVGHSLGGAILDEFISMGLLKSGLSYNPAIQPQHLRANIANQRIYQEGDPLYQVMGRFSRNAEVRQAPQRSFFSRAIGSIPYIGRAYNYLQSHGLANFRGGIKYHSSSRRHKL